MERRMGVYEPVGGRHVADARHGPWRSGTTAGGDRGSRSRSGDLALVPHRTQTTKPDRTGLRYHPAVQTQHEGRPVGDFDDSRPSPASAHASSVRARFRGSFAMKAAKHMESGANSSARRGHDGDPIQAQVHHTRLAQKAINEAEAGDEGKPLHRDVRGGSRIYYLPCTARR